MWVETFRQNKSPVCGVVVVGQCDGNNREDEVGVLCEGEVNGGSARCETWHAREMMNVFGDNNAHKEHCNVS